MLHINDITRMLKHKIWRSSSAATLICEGSPLFLKIGLTTHVNHSSGITPVSKIKLDNLVYKDKNMETVDEIYSYVPVPQEPYRGLIMALLSKRFSI